MNNLKTALWMVVLSRTGEVSRVARWWRLVPRPARRVVVGAAGGLVVAAGLVMLVVPGPGLLTIVLGLGILAAEFSWARRLLREASSRLPGRRSRAGSSSSRGALGARRP